jgi:arylsulfatase A-like enzyme
MIRTPWKPLAAGKRTAALVEHVDLYPSLAEIAGIPVDRVVESIDGTSWASVLDDPTAQHKSAVFAQYPRCWPSNATDDPSAFTHMARCAGVDKDSFAYMGYSIRTTSFRYTEWAAWDGTSLRPLWNVSGGVELYDHTDDPPANSRTSFDKFENTNEAGDAPRAPLVAQMSKQLRAFFDAH